MTTQPVTNQKGEIEFRKKLYLQQVKGEKIFADEFDSAGIENILIDRMNATLARMTQLRGAGIPLSPYLEIGAERCQRSLIMENELEADGAAIDISYDLLKSSDHYQKVFAKVKSPARLCCDANNLPFMSNSIPFVFCYETLHHFPEPGPIVSEIYRVLRPGGYFLFEEEPYKKVLHFSLYKGSKIYSKQGLNRSTIRKVFDHFLSAQACNEVEHGVIENHDIPIVQWKDALRPFEAKDVWLRFAKCESELFNPASYFKYVAACLLGGTICGICQKRAGRVNELTSIYAALICPSCKQAGSEEPLSQDSSLFVCSKCSKTYPVVDGVVFVFAHEKFIELYPDIFRSFVAA